MNAFGISVFYGATDVDTCISEVRPPVGSHVIIGKFKFLKKVLLLDLDVLSEVYVEGSYFDSNFGTRKSHAVFLKQLVGELTKPVMPENEVFEYLPTQIIAEYIAEKITPKLDGIIFKSSQSSKGKQNIILFQKSCIVAPYILPNGTTISVSYGMGPDDEDSITIREEINNEIQTQSSSPDPFKENLQGLYNESDYTLSLNLKKDISVFVVQSTKYKKKIRPVSRHKNENFVIESISSNIDDTKSTF